MNRDRAPLLGAAAASAVVLAAVVLGLSTLYGASRDRLDEAMGERLLGVAGSLAALVDGERIFAWSVGDSTAAGYVDSLTGRLHRVLRQQALAEITLCDPDGRVLTSTSAGQLPGLRNDFWDLDRGAVDLARQGYAQTTRLYRLQDTFQKSAHAPVLLPDPGLGEDLVVAVLTVSGNPDFFDSLARLRRAALAAGLAVVAVLLLVGALLLRLQRSLARIRASILRQEKLAAMGRMTANIAHEIRNPLGIIRGAGQHLQRVLQEAGIEDEAAGFIPEEVDRLDHILTGYLAFGSDVATAPEPFDLGTLVRRTARLMAGELAAAQVTVALPDELPAFVVLGDPRRLQQVLMNLLLNARDAMPQGGPVSVSLAVSAAGARLELADRGPGLAGCDPETLFEPFRSGKEKGSGLGLAVSRRLMADLGGSLTLHERNDPPGAVARLDLPPAPGDVPPAATRK